MAKAIWKGTLVAESDRFETVEGNVYFPPDSVNKAYLKPSDTHTVCSWKGVASYYHIEADGEVNQDAAWYYPQPKAAAEHIKDHVAFWKGVEVQQ